MRTSKSSQGEGANLVTEKEKWKRKHSFKIAQDKDETFQSAFMSWYQKTSNYAILNMLAYN